MKFNVDGGNNSNYIEYFIHAFFTAMPVKVNDILKQAPEVLKSDYSAIYACGDGIVIIYDHDEMLQYDEHTPDNATIMVVAHWGYRWDGSPNDYKCLEICDALAKFLVTEPDELINGNVSISVD